MMRLLGILWLLLRISHGAQGQPEAASPAASDSVRLLEEVRITDLRLSEFASGDKVVPVREHTIGLVEHTNLAELLTHYSGLHVRSYGPSGLSTASLRGTGSNHTPVFWEGINLQSVMNGSLDLTLVPTSFVDDVAVQYGGAGALYGSGTLGGAIHLATNPPPGVSGWSGQLYQHLGSFGRHYTGINAGFHQPTLAAQVRVFDHRADNDFAYQNIYTNREAYRQNAGIRQQGVLAQTQWQPTPQHTLSAKYWYQDNLAHIPEVAAAGGEARATQADEFHRAVVRWHHSQAQQAWHIRTAFLHHRLVYDDQVLPPSYNQSTSWIAEADHTYYFSSEYWLHTGLTHTYETAQVDSYARSPQRHRTALFVSYRARPLPSLEATAGARASQIDGTLSPLLPSVGLRYQLSPVWQLSSKAARSFRIPTFNDLYWAGAGGQGNPDLRPETGWSTEVGLQAEALQTEETQFTFSLTAFSNSVDQWISWIPLTGSVWTPVNVEHVWARGVELNSSLLHHFNSLLAVRFWGSYTFTKSTKERISQGGNPAELHSQLIYTPYHQAKASASVDYRSLTLGYSFVLTGEQYTTASNHRLLPAYQTSDVSLTYAWHRFLSHQVQISATVQNVSNTQYHVREGYPMPGRHYQLSLVYQFDQSSHHP